MIRCPGLQLLKLDQKCHTCSVTVAHPGRIDHDPAWF
jgi:hypothetical protein